MSTPNPWFRHYVGMATDPKFGGIARRAKETRERVVFIWSCILESASHLNENGKFLIDIDVMADLLHCENDSIETILIQLESCGLTENGAVTKWHSRQYLSDNSTERSRRHRTKKRQSGNNCSDNSGGNDDATLHGVAGTASNASATPPESESDTDTETEKDKETKVVSVSGGVGEKATTDRLDRPFFFVLTAERMALAQSRGFGDAAWVQEQTERFIERNHGKHLNQPETAWLNWLNAGKQFLGNRAKPPAKPVKPTSYLESRNAGRVMV